MMWWMVCNFQPTISWWEEIVSLYPFNFLPLDIKIHFMETFNRLFKTEENRDPSYQSNTQPYIPHINPILNHNLTIYWYTKPMFRDWMGYYAQSPQLWPSSAALRAFLVASSWTSCASKRWSLSGTERLPGDTRGCNTMCVCINKT